MITAVYTYTDADGSPLYRKLRDAEKNFTWERYADGEWVSGRDGGNCPLYNLPAVIKAAESGKGVYVVEGEKDADRLTAMGHAATTSPDGAGPGKWPDSYTRTLAGARVRIIADRDEPGHGHAQEVYKSLLGSVKSVEILEADVDAKGADVSDHLDAGKSLADLLPVEPDIAPGLGPRPEYPVKSLAGPLRHFTEWAIRDGLHPEAAGPAALAALAAVCGDARISSPIKATPALWLAVIGAASSGKSPAIRHAFELIDRWNEQQSERFNAEKAEYEKTKQQGGQARQPVMTAPFTSGNQTPEALIRIMHRTNGVTAIVVDELDAFLSSMGAYSTTKRGGDAERARFREMWSGRPFFFSRVGTGGSSNATEIYIAQPVLTIFGPMLPGETWKLGGVTNGDWARWLPSSVPPEVPEIPEFGTDKPGTWTEAITRLIGLRGFKREWRLTGDSFRLFADARQRWVAGQFDAPEHVSQALMKAADQACRIALVIAESMSPGQGGDIPPGAISSAIALVDYSIKVWASIPGERSVLAVRSEERAELNAAARLLAWIQRRPKDENGIRRATGREIQMAKVAGCKTAEDVRAMINAYVAEYPGTVTTVNNERGRPSVYVREPVGSLC